MFFLVETDFLSITCAHIHIPVDTLTCILQEPAATATDELEQQAAQVQPPAEPRLHPDLLSLDFPVEEQAAPRGHFLTVNISVKFACTVCNHLCYISSRAF